MNILFPPEFKHFQYAFFFFFSFITVTTKLCCDSIIIYKLIKSNILKYDDNRAVFSELFMPREICCPGQSPPPPLAPYKYVSLGIRRLNFINGKKKKTKSQILRRQCTVHTNFEHIWKIGVFFNLLVSTFRALVTRLICPWTEKVCAHVRYKLTAFHEIR